MADLAIPRGDAVALTRTLVAIDSRNPALVADAPGEGPVARVLADVLRAWGMRVEIYDALPGRPNVIARTGRPGARALMFNGHLDVVGTEGMTHAPFVPEMRGSRLYGRGATDMKGGIAAMAAAAALADDGTLDAEIIVAAVIDEEEASAGTRVLLERGVRAEMAIVTEPTELAVMPAHRGFVWIEIHVEGRAAHGSRHDLGIDAIRHAALVLAELDMHEERVLTTRLHPLLGRASLHASHMHGGIGMSTYPDRCVLSLERRTIPGETTADALREVESAIERVRQRKPTMRASARVLLAQGPSDVAVDAPVVRALSDALRAEGEVVRVEGMSAWTDAALLNDAGIPAVCFGPGNIKLAHAAEEWIEIPEIERATSVLTRLAREFGARGV
jgi:acetylornithine deacetylase